MQAVPGHGTDHGSAFTSQAFRKRFSELGITHRRAATATPKARPSSSPGSKLKQRWVWREELETLEQARAAIGAYLDSYHHRPHWDFVERCAERFAAEGIELHVTETDVQEQDTPGTRKQRCAAQAACYHEIARRAITADATQLDSWGYVDRYTWIGSFGIVDAAPLLFDFDYRPKLAYYAVKDAFPTGREHLAARRQTRGSTG